MRELKVFDYYMDLGGSQPTRFALEEFNRLKNAQLQLVRVVKVHRHLLSAGITSLYDITLEAIDAGVAKLYRARVSDHEDKAENHMLMCKKKRLDCSNNSCNKLCLIDNIYDFLIKGKMQNFGRQAVKLFNDEKNAELRFKRGVRGNTLALELYYMTLEATDAGVKKVYQALLSTVDDHDRDKDIRRPDFMLHLFGHLDDNGRLSILIDKRHEQPEVFENKGIRVSRSTALGYCRYKDVDSHAGMWLEH